MARYTLILPDKIYISLAQKAVAGGVSFGKYINQLLANFLEAEPQADRSCFFCGGAPVVEGETKTNKLVLLCARHKYIAKELKIYKLVEVQGSDTK
ncbi:hypothetical protein [Huginn virus]|nr:hypothetical protein [Huginn virus]